MEHHQQQDGAGILVRVDVPDLKSQTRVIINRMDPIGFAKQALLEKLSHDWPPDIANNYGFYIPATSGRKVGRFLDESRPLVESEYGPITHLEFQYKRRDYTGVGLSEKVLTKANSKSNVKKLIDYVTSGSSIKKVEKLLDSGLDPNFILDDGNTPLGIVCGRNGHAQLIQTLISGGAHIDFRGGAGLTPIHRAAIGGNVQATKTLLSLGASPNYIDAKGLTPLYHASVMGDDIAVCESLLSHHAFVGNTDNIGWTELHQIAKHGYVYLIDLFLLYGADIDALNKAGNTPLHVAAQHGQLETAIHLMQRGANRSILNASKQPPNQIAILCGHRHLAKQIANFDEIEIDPIQSKRRHHSFGEDTRKEHSAQSQHTTGYQTLPSKKQPEQSAVAGSGIKRSKLVKGQSLTSIPSQFSTQVPSLSTNPPIRGPINQAPPPPVISVGNKRSKTTIKETVTPMSVSSLSDSPKKESPRSQQRAGGRRYSTDRKKSSPNPSPILSKSPSPTGEIRERLYPISQPGKTYIANTNVEPQMEGDLQLTKGALLEVLYVGKGGYWEGICHGKQGWFPQNAITEKLDDDKEEYPSSLPSLIGGSTGNTLPMDNKSGIKMIAIRKGEKGFGFAMRGIKAVNMAKFKPTPQVPALQYVARIDKGSSAEQSGLQKGDFIIEVNGVNTTYSTHEEVVGIIKQSSSFILKLKVITPLSSSPKKQKSEVKHSPPVEPKEDTEQFQNVNTTKLPTGNESSQESEEDTKIQHKIFSLATVTHSMTPTSTSKSITTNTSLTKPDTSLQGSPLIKEKKPATMEQPKEFTSHASMTEELIQKEEDSYRKLLEEDEEEPLSPFAQQLRKASQDHFKRSKTTDSPQTKSKINKDTIPASTNNTSKEKNKTDHHYSNQDHSSNRDQVYDISHPKDNVRTTMSAEDEDDDWEETETLTAYNDNITTTKKFILDTSSNNSPKEKYVPKYSPKVTPKNTHSPKIVNKIEQTSSSSSSSSPKITSDSLHKQSSPKQTPKDNISSSSSKRDHSSSITKKDLSSLSSSSSKQSPRNSSAKQDSSSLFSKDPSSPKNGPFLPKKDSPLLTRASPPSTRDLSPPKKDLSLSKKDSSTTSSKTFPPPPTKPKPSNLKDTSSPQKPAPKPLKENDAKEKQEEPVTTQPFTSLKDKFEKLAAQNTKQQSPLFVKKRHLNKPVQSQLEKQKQITVLMNDTKETELKKEIEPQKEFEVKKEEKEEDPSLPPPPPVLDDPNSNRFSVISFEDLPLPPELLDEIDEDETSPVSTSISPSSIPSPPITSVSPLPSISPPPLSPPPPILSSEEEKLSSTHIEDPINNDYQLPPPYSSDEEEEDLPPPPIYNEDTPIIPAVLEEQSHHDDTQQANNDDEDNDMLNDIVGQLIQLTNNDNNKDDSEESDDDSLPPPPLPSRPPPDSDDEEGEDTKTNISNEQSSEEPFIDKQLSNDDDDLPLPLPEDIPFEEEEDVLIPPPLDEDYELPLPLYEEDAIPPPFEEEEQELLPLDDIPPPQNIHSFNQEEFVPPPFFEEEDGEDTLLPPPEDDDVPLPSFEEDPIPATLQDNFAPPPPPPPPAPLSDDDEQNIISDVEEDDDTFLPPPMLDESYEQDYNDDNKNSSPLPPPPPLDLSDDDDDDDSASNQSDENESIPVSDWSVDQVCDWLDEIGLGMYQDTFSSNEIIGEHLIDLSRDDLKDLGITKVGHIKTLKQKLQEKLNS